MNSVEELDVFKLAHELALKIYSVTKKFPREEMYSLSARCTGSPPSFRCFENSRNVELTTEAVLPWMACDGRTRLSAIAYLSATRQSGDLRVDCAARYGRSDDAQRSGQAGWPLGTEGKRAFGQAPERRYRPKRSRRKGSPLLA
jgi:hypothetical protein